MSQIKKGIRRPNPTNLKKTGKALDVPENKKEMYREFYPHIEGMTKSII